MAALAEAGRLPNLVVDPVMVTSNGDRLLDPDAEGTYRHRLFPASRVVTPNLHETQVLLGAELTGLDDVRHAARELHRTGCDVVVIRGGHPTADAIDEAVDVWYGSAGPRAAGVTTRLRPDPDDYLAARSSQRGGLWP